jgi:hypothetical protein
MAINFDFLKSNRKKMVPFRDFLSSIFQKTSNLSRYCALVYKPSRKSAVRQAHSLT